MKIYNVCVVEKQDNKFKGKKSEKDKKGILNGLIKVISGSLSVLSLIIAICSLYDCQKATKLSEESINLAQLSLKQAGLGSKPWYYSSDCE